MPPHHEANPPSLKWRPIIFVTLIFTVMGFGFAAATAAQLRLLEDIICKQYYAKHSTEWRVQDGTSIPEKLCKVVEVQESLARLLGWQAFFEGVPGLLLAMPYGVLADKYGRILVLVTSLVGLTLGNLWILIVCWTEMSVKLIWLSSGFVFIGGGSTVTAAILMTILTDSTPEDQRSKMFFYFQATSIVVELIAPPVGSFLMTRNIWIPMLLQFALSCSAIPLAMMVPETRVLKSEVEEGADNEESDSSSSSELLGTGEEGKPPKGLVLSIIHHCVKTTKFVVRDRTVLFLVITFIVNSFGRQSMSLILQYVSKRYSWPLAKTSYLLSLRAAATLLLFAIILPGLDTILVKKLGMGAKIKNLQLAKMSIVVVTAGFVAIAFAPEAWVVIIGLSLYTLGSGFATFVRSLVSSLVEQKMLGTLYSALSIMDTSGALLAGPLAAEAFRWGMNKGGVWVGLPYMLSVVMFALCCLVVFSVRLPKEDEALSYHAVATTDEDVERAV